jgi:hypothetical protein
MDVFKLENRRQVCHGGTGTGKVYAVKLFKLIYKIAVIQ